MQVSNRFDNSQALFGFLAFVPYFIGFILLSNFGNGNVFDSAVVFFMIAAFTLPLLLYISSKYKPDLQWAQGLDTKNTVTIPGTTFKISKDIAWIIGSYLAVLATMYGLVVMLGGTSFAILVALTAGGAIISVALFKTQTLLATLVIHGAYNTTAIALSTGVFGAVVPLSASPIYVPSFDVNGIPLDLASQGIMQFFAVALAEELLRISVAFGILLLTPFGRAAALGGSTIAWVFLHTILSYRV